MLQFGQTEHMTWSNMKLCTKHYLIRPKYKQDDLNAYSLKIGDMNLTRVGNDCEVKYVKFLGLLIDENLTWKGHINHVNQKISKSLYMLNQVKYCFNLECLRLLYYSFIYPHILYGLLCWGNGDPTQLQRTFLLQKRAVRIISKAKYNSHTEPLFKKKNILKLDDLYQYVSLKFMFDYRKLTLPSTFENVFMLNRNLPNSRLTRQSDHYFLPKHRSNYVLKFPLFTLPRIWNNWIHVVDSINTTHKLKRVIKTTILNTYSETIVCQNPRCPDCRPHQ